VNVRLSKLFVWQSGVVYNQQFHINTYSCKIDFSTLTTDATQTNLAYERIRYWMENILDNSVLMSDSNELLPAYQATGQRIITLPDEPVDQLVGIMLFSKLNSIAQERVTVTDLSVSSIMGDEVIYNHSHNESFVPFPQSAWWDDPSPIWYNKKETRVTEKVVNLDRVLEWADLDLDWKRPEEKGNNQVVFANFASHEEK